MSAGRGGLEGGGCGWCRAWGERVRGSFVGGVSGGLEGQGERARGWGCGQEAGQSGCHGACAPAEGATRLNPSKKLKSLPKDPAKVDPEPEGQPTQGTSQTGPQITSESRLKKPVVSKPQPETQPITPQPTSPHYTQQWYSSRKPRKPCTHRLKRSAQRPKVVLRPPKVLHPKVHQLQLLQPAASANRPHPGGPAAGARQGPSPRQRQAREAGRQPRLAGTVDGQLRVVV